MINPSASGWIDKFFNRHNKKMPENNIHLFYRLIRDTGFIYGHVVHIEHIDEKETIGWTPEETTKVALLGTLYEIYCLVTQNGESKIFIEKAILFYKQMRPENFALLKKVLPASPPSHELENILDERIRTNDTIIGRSFSHILTNALLFMDALALRQYLLNNEIPEKYLKKLEETALSIVSVALKTKSVKSEYDNLLIKLFESSVRYTKFSTVNTETLEMLELDYFSSNLEKSYLLDIAGMAIWNDSTAEKNEIDFLYNLAAQLSVPDEEVAESIASFEIFIKKYKKEISYFNYSNPVKHFYDHASQYVGLLIKRNSKRLIKELSNNGELMMLITHSTHRSLDKEEKKKIKKQLLEICKTVPSLTIFLLPGGSLLLPLLIKFIPQLLPSVFNENLDNE